MIKLLHIATLLSLGIILNSCSIKPVSEGELKALMLNKEFGLYKEIVQKDVLFNVYIKPSSLVAAQELRSYKNPTQFIIDSIEKKYNKFLYFMLEISKNDKGVLQSTSSYKQYSELLHELSFSMQNHISISPDNKENIEPHNFQLGQFYGMEIASSMLIAFRREELISARKLVFTINEFGLQTGPVSFEFRVKDIKNIPPLAY